MNCRKVLLFCRMVAKSNNKCLKLNADGTVCGKIGSCIHNWIPARFGAK